MILIQDDIVAEIDGLLIHGKKQNGSYFVFDPDAIQGFYDGVSVKRTETVRPNQWGDFSEPSLLNARVLTLTGTAIAMQGPGELLQMRDKFTSLLIDGKYREIAITNSSGSRYLNVTLQGQPAWVVKSDNVALWKLDLYSPDPRMYGPIKSRQLTDSIITGGTDYPVDYPVDYGQATAVNAISISNNGNTHSWPKFYAIGDYNGGFSITDNGSNLIRYDGMVTRSAPVLIDTAAGTATQNGVDKSNLLSSRQWFSIPPGQSIQPIFIPSADVAGWCEIIYRDTWI